MSNHVSNSLLDSKSVYSGELDMVDFDYDYLANFWMLQEELYIKEQEEDEQGNDAEA